MTTETMTPTNWIAVAQELGMEFAPRAAAHDADDSFVTENYDALKAYDVFSAGVPGELGGGGASFPELCQFLRELGRHCSSTALSLSMHMHLVAAAVWRWHRGDPVEPLLRDVTKLNYPSQHDNTLCRLYRRYPPWMPVERLSMANASMSPSFDPNAGTRA